MLFFCLLAACYAVKKIRKYYARKEVAHMAHRLYYLFLRWPLIWRILSLAMVLIITFGVTIHVVEPETFPTVHDGIWWAIVTTSTVGYGDYSPASPKGRAVGVLLILFGGGVLSAYFVSLASATVTRQTAYSEGKAGFGREGHIIIVGWNERSKEVISQLSKVERKRPIVLIDQTLTQNPYTDHRLHFIKGKPYIDAVLLKANVAEADYMLITADQHKNEIQADMETIMTLLAVKGLHPELYCSAEILKAEQIANAKRAGANEVIQTNKQTSYIMMNSLVSHGMSETILSMLNHLKGSNLRFIPVEEEWGEWTFQRLSAALLEQRQLLLGIRDGEETEVNPPLHRKVKKGQQLLIISD